MRDEEKLPLLTLFQVEMGLTSKLRGSFSVAPWEHSFWEGQRFKFSDDETIFPTKPTVVNPLLMSCFSRYHNKIREFK